MSQSIRPALALTLLALTLACADRGHDLPDPNAAPVDIYMAGDADLGQGLKGVVWKNGVAATVGTTSYILTGVQVAGGVVYTCGYATGSSGAYWKDGVPTYLSDPADPLQSSGANALAVSGGDVYVAGYAWKSGPDSPYGLTVPTYWKNGVPVTIGGGSRELTCVAASGGDVYVGGSINAGVLVAAYWKNGIPNLLPSGSGAAAVLGLTLAGADVYATGYVYAGGHTVPVYWKNGVAVTLPDLGYGGQGIAIRVSGGDVYVAGAQYQNNGPALAVYWKNGAVTSVGPGTVTGLALQGSDVYMCGSNGNAMLWKNGGATALTRNVTFNAIWVQAQ